MQQAKKHSWEADPSLALAQEEALTRLDAALDACRLGPECPKTGAPDCIDLLGEYRAAKIAAGRLGLQVQTMRKTR